MRLDILAIGNALVDILAFADEEIAASLSLHPNAAAHVSPERLDELLLAFRDPIVVSGGSAANAAKAAAALGFRCAFSGCVGSEDREADRWALAFERDLADYGVRCALETRPKPTGRCLVIHMPGDLTSIACAPSAAPLFRPGQVDDLPEATFVLLDGQTLRNPELVSAAARLARRAGSSLALDVAAPSVADERAEAILDLIQAQDVILFMNEVETLILANRLAPTVLGEDARAKGDTVANAVFGALARSRPGLTVVSKRGAAGAVAWDASGYREAPGLPATVLDATGAGDVFAGAFLSARIAGKDPDGCLSFANLAAREAVLVPGTRLPQDRFIELARGL